MRKVKRTIRKHKIETADALLIHRHSGRCRHDEETLLGLLCITNLNLYQIQLNILDSSRILAASLSQNIFRWLKPNGNDCFAKKLPQPMNY